jgi:6-phospho-beta-glucosidase
VTKIAVLGGSAVSTPQLAAAIADAELPAVELALVGRSEGKLRAVAAAACVAGRGVVTISQHVDPQHALEGAGLVLSQVRVGGLEGRAFDETFSRDLGIPGEETVGPGGFSAAWRTLPLMRELMRQVKSIAPSALVLNLTNPASMVHRVTETAGLTTITLCDAPIVLARKLAALLSADPDAARPSYVGMNHCGWITTLEIDGEDRLPDAIARTDELTALTGVDGDVAAWLGAVANPYLRYLYHPGRQLEAQRSKDKVRANELEELERQALAEYAQGADPASAAARRPAPWYSECVVPVLRSILQGERVRMIVDIANQGLLSFLPQRTTIEVAAELENGLVEPLPPDPLPLDAQAILVELAAYDELAVPAILEGDHQGCARALAANPLVPSLDVARELVARIERRHGPLAKGRG